MDALHYVFLILLIIAVAAAVGSYFFAITKGKNLVEKKFTDLGKTAESIIDTAKKEGEKRQKEMVADAKKEA